MSSEEIPAWYVTLKNLIGFSEIVVLYWLLSTMLFDQLKKPHRKQHEK